MLLCAGLSDGDSHMRIDGGNAKVDDVKSLARKTFAQQDVEIARGAECGLRSSHRRRFAKNKNAAGIRGFPGRELERAGPARQLGREELQTELFVVNKEILDRKSTRLNSSHLGISYAVFCLKKKKEHGSI